MEENGDPLWRFQTGGPIHSEVVAERNSIYFGSWDTNFYALDANSGKLLWKFQTSLGYVSPIDLKPLIEARGKSIFWKAKKEGKDEFYRSVTISGDYEGVMTKYGREFEFGSDFEGEPYKSGRKYR